MPLIFLGFEDSSVDVNINTSHESLTSDDMEIDLTSDKVISEIFNFIHISTYR